MPCLRQRKVTALEGGEHTLGSHGVEASEGGVRFQFGEGHGKQQLGDALETNERTHLRHVQLGRSLGLRFSSTTKLASDLLNIFLIFAPAFQKESPR